MGATAYEGVGEWLRVEPRPEAPAEGAVSVTAVLVAHNGADWLPRSLRALAALDRRPTRIIAVDAGSDDATRSLLVAARDARVIDDVLVSEARGFAAAVNETMAAEAGLGRGEPDWIWLLHDDAEVAPDALTALLAAVTRNESVDVTGPKLLRAGRGAEPPRIASLGTSIATTSRRVDLVAPGEVDQQQSRSQPVLAVESCGLFVRGRVFAALGGLDPEIGGLRDGVAFGWRATEAGYRVVTTPEAVVVHRGATRSGQRRTAVAGAHPARADRALGMDVVAAHRGPLAGIGLVLACLLRALGLLLGKAPSRSLDELAAAREFLGSGHRRRSLRERARATRTDAGRRAAAGFVPGVGASVRHGLGLAVAGIVAWWDDVAGRHDHGQLDELTGDDFASAESDDRSSWRSLMGLSLIVSVVATVAALRDVVGLGRLHGPLLLPSRTTLGDAFAAYLDPIAGAPGVTAPPWLGLVALASTVSFGQPEFFVTGLMLLSVPGLAVLAWLVLRRLDVGSRVRWWASFTYALLPLLLGAVNRGSLATLALAWLLPPLALTLRALWTRGERRSAWGLGLVLLALIAVEPLVLPLAAVALVAAAALTPGFDWRRLLPALGVPLVVLLPWWWTLLNHPGRWLTGPDPMLGADATPPGWGVLLGRAASSGLPPLWVSAVCCGVVLGAAVVALAVRAERAVWLGWAVGLVGLAGAVLLPRLVAVVPPLDLPTRPEALPWALLGFAGLLLAGALGLDRALAGWHHRRAPQAIVAVVGVLALLVGAGWSTWAGMGGAGAAGAPGTAGAPGAAEDGLLTRSSDTIGARGVQVPAFLRGQMDGPAAVRVLVISVVDGVPHWALSQDGQNQLGDADLGGATGGSTRLRDLSASVTERLLAGAADDSLPGDLEALGVSWVWAHGTDADLRGRISNSPGLGAPSGDDRNGWLWAVTRPTARGLLVTPRENDPLVVPRAGATIPAGTEGRRLLLAEPDDPRWRARLDGVALPRADADGRIGFAVPATGGHLTWSLSDPWRPLLALAQLLALIVVIVLAAPSLRAREHDGETGRRVEKGGAR